MTALTYHSALEKTEAQAHQYFQTQVATRRYLAYRDIPSIIRKYVKGTRALDYGCGTGGSSVFLDHLGFDVIGVDVSHSMLNKAKTTLPDIEFYDIERMPLIKSMDFVFSSFVLCELSTKEQIVAYLEKANKFLKKGGIFIAITSSEHLYSPSRKWFTFDTNFVENQNLISGKIAKIQMKASQMEFYDYYWEKSDYLECFEKTNFQILHTHAPLGSPQDPYFWQDELSCSPYTLFVAQKR